MWKRGIWEDMGKNGLVYCETVEPHEGDDKVPQYLVA